MSKKIDFPGINYQGEDKIEQKNAAELLNEAATEQMQQKPNFILLDGKQTDAVQSTTKQVNEPIKANEQVQQNAEQSSNTYVDLFSQKQSQQLGNVETMQEQNVNNKQYQQTQAFNSTHQNDGQTRAQRVNMNDQSGKKSSSQAPYTSTKKIFLTAFMGTLAALVLFVGGTQAFRLINNGSKVNQGSGNSSGQIIQKFGNSLDVSGVVEAVSPGIVTVHVKTQTNTIFGGIQEAEGQGSGVVYLREDGKIYILTNAHVIQNASNVGVYRNDLGKQAIDEAKVLNYDNESDIAVLVLENPKNEYNVTVDFGNSDELKLGEQVIAVGSPLGEEFTGSVTGGIISGLDRQIPLDNWGTKYSTFIQTDAAINGGNSGGGLIDMQGRLIGINSAKISSADNIGLAIPSNIVLSVMQKMDVPMPEIDWELEQVSQERR